MKIGLFDVYYLAWTQALLFCEGLFVAPMLLLAATSRVGSDIYITLI